MNVIELVMGLLFMAIPIVPIVGFPGYLYRALTARRNGVPREEAISLYVIVPINLWVVAGVVAMFLPYDRWFNYCDTRETVLLLFSGVLLIVFGLYLLSWIVAWMVRPLKSVLMANRGWLFLLCFVYPLIYAIWVGGPDHGMYLHSCKYEVMDAARLGEEIGSAVADFDEKNGRLPTSIDELPGLDTRDRAGKVSIDATGRITVQLRSDLKDPIAGKTLVLTPRADGRWDCTGGTVPREFRPAGCRE